MCTDDGYMTRLDADEQARVLLALQKKKTMSSLTPPDPDIVYLVNPCEFCGAQEATLSVELSNDRDYNVCVRCAPRVRGM